MRRSLPTFEKESYSGKPIFFPELESLRGLAALLVVFYHIPAWSRVVYQLTFIRNASLCVDFFFVLSGFVMMHNYGAIINSGHEMGRFVSLRFFRLYPVHLLFLIVFLFIEIAKFIALRHHAGTVFSNAAFRDNSFGAFVENLFLVQALGFSSHAMSFNYPSWSISVEFYTYIIFGFGVWMLGARNRALSLFSATIALSSYCFLFHIRLPATSEVAELPSRWLPWSRCIAGFFTGCLLPAIASDSVPSRKINGAISIAALVAIAILLAQPFERIHELLFLAVSSLLILSLIWRRDGLLNRILRTSAIMRLGAMSYSLYMSHAAVIWSVNQTARYLLHAPERVVDGNMEPYLSPWLNVVYYPLTICICIFLASIVYNNFERPIRDHFKSRLKRKVNLSYPVASTA
jgi:peptidoglycan/LPS O-acetylase OafA/YrhL